MLVGLPWRGILGGTALLWLALIGSGAAADDQFDWRSDWAVRDGFSIRIDTEGYQFPTAIAFVPEPGPDPKDPLYFVAELRGTIKVVTNDRTVSNFAGDFASLSLGRELPDPGGAAGVTGLCVEPAHGYVFATFIYRDEDGLYRNDIIRFETEPVTFSTRPKSSVRFTAAFSSPESAFQSASGGHQIGGCRSVGGHVYIGVGDGHQPPKARALDSMLGKVVRMDVDGRPVPTNPFYDATDGLSARDYIWSYGFRNPFGLAIVDGRVFVADNGPGVDRFLEARLGWDYLYDGTDNSVATNALAVLVPGRGLAHVAHYSAPRGGFPEAYDGTFFAVVSGRPEELTPDTPPKIVALSVAPAEDRLLRPPETFLRYLGDGPQALASLAMGDDGLYFAPVFGRANVGSAIFKIRYDPESGHPFTIDEERNARVLMQEHGCYGCHQLGNTGSDLAPVLDRDVLIPRLDARLNDADYRRHIQQVEETKGASSPSFEQARRDVLAAEGKDRTRAWLIHRIMHPSFDDPEARMPALGVSQSHAQAIADYLIEGDGEGYIARLRGLLPRSRRELAVASFGVGLIAGGAALGTVLLLVAQLRRWRRR